MDNEVKDQAERDVYETSYLVLPSVSEDNHPSIVDTIKKAFSRAGGVEVDGETPFKHPLAYPMSKTVGASKYIVNEAYIGWVKFDLPAEALAQEGVEHPIQKIKAEIEKIPEVLRFLIVKAPRKTDFTFAKAKALIREKEEKEREKESEGRDVEPVEEIKEVVVE